MNVTEGVQVVEYAVLLNREEDEMGRLQIFSRLRSEDAYQPGDKLEEVFRSIIIRRTAEDVLDVIFEWFNRGAPHFIGDDLYPQRSLSVGDVVEVDGVRYACAPVGWKQIA